MWLSSRCCRPSVGSTVMRSRCYRIDQAPVCATARFCGPSVLPYLAQATIDTRTHILRSLLLRTHPHAHTHIHTHTWRRVFPCAVPTHRALAPPAVRQLAEALAALPGLCGGAVDCLKPPPLTWLPAPTRACVRAYVRARVRACVRACALMSNWRSVLRGRGCRAVLSLSDGGWRPCLHCLPVLATCLC